MVGYEIPSCNLIFNVSKREPRGSVVTYLLLSDGMPNLSKTVWPIFSMALTVNNEKKI
jgi:hypothetical protein